MHPSLADCAARLASLALLSSLSCATAAMASTSDPWSGWHLAAMASDSRLSVKGDTVRGDGAFGSNASQESAAVHDRSAGLALALGWRQRLTSGLVVGAESDLAWLGHRATQVSPVGSGVYVGQPVAVLRHDAHWLATLRLTAGWQLGQALLYATGGLAVLHDEVRRTQHRANGATLLTEPVFTESDRATRVGHVVGAGAAWHLGGAWSVRAEYLHARLPRTKAYFPDARGGAQASFSSVQGRIAERRSTFNTVRVGLEWAFRGL